MKKIESYTELNAKIMKQFRRGMVTNSFLAKEEYETEIAQGTLYFHESENAFLIFRTRATHAVMNFWLNGEMSPESLQFPTNTVVEIAHRERDTALAECVNQWKKCGFTAEFVRKRMICTETCDTPAENSVKTALPDDFDAAKALLRENFSPLTGCLPNDNALVGDIGNGGVQLYEMNQKPCGLLHFTKSKNKTELRHLCVAESARGQGIGRALVCEYNRITNGMTRHVWVRADNLPAVEIYETCGYQADGMISDVLIRR